MGNSGAQSLGRLSIAGCFVLFLIDGCRQGYEECSPGEVRSCPVEVCIGKQTCEKNGFFGACDCPGVGGTSVGGFGGFGAGGTSFGGVGGAFGVGGSGGSFGAGGSIGAGGSKGGGGSLGTGGSSGAPGGLGRACTANSQCTVGLECVLAASGKLGGSGPAKGYCTAPCVPSATINDCAMFGASAVCHDFGSSSSALDGGARAGAYCIEGCNFGPLGLGGFDSAKCHGRPEVACSPVFKPTSTSCTVDSNCPTGALCIESKCNLVASACLPRCNADGECGSGFFCDPGAGLCRSSAPPGMSLGQQCVLAADGGADPCRGDCTAFTASGGRTEHVCVEHCTIGAIPACGWNGVGSGLPAPALCILPSPLVTERGGPGVGDVGMCTPLCDCNRDCAHPAFVCRDLANPSLQQAVRHRGYCTTPETTDGGTDPGIKCD